MPEVCARRGCWRLSLARGEGRNQAKMRARVLKPRDRSKGGCIGAGNVPQESSAYGGHAHAEAFARVLGRNGVKAEYMDCGLLRTVRL